MRFRNKGTAAQGAAAAPFPLRRWFYGLVLPGLLLLVVAVVFATTETVRQATIEVLLQLASRKVDGMAAGVDTTAPEPWQRLLAGETLGAADLTALAAAFGDEQREAQIGRLKIYGPDRVTLYATEHDLIGRVEDKPELIEALDQGEASVRVESDAGGAAYYELYLPYRVDGRVATVFEIYEPISGFDALLWKVVKPVLIIPLALFAVTLVVLGWLVGRAQKDIDLRTGLIVELGQRVERLVSSQAVAAMRSTASGDSAAEAIELTLFYSDVRGFTSFAEQHAPGEVIGFLNRIVGLQVEIIEAHGGDIDKMIGDAVFARFHGPERAARAIDAAVAVVRAVRAAGLERGIGIGLYSGPVVAGLIGRGSRFDYTVIGDSVNSAARLCGMAGDGEIIADTATAAQARGVAFGPQHRVQVRGRAGELAVRSLQVDEDTAVSRVRR